MAFYKTDISFIEKLDSNNNLMGFNNGIYDLRTLKFRDGTPEDMITISVGYDYNPTKNHEN